MYFNQSLEESLIASSHASNNAENQQLVQQERYQYIGSKQEIHLVVTLNDESFTKRVLVRVQPHSSISYLKQKIGETFDRFDQFQGLKQLRAKALYKILSEQDLKLRKDKSKVDERSQRSHQPHEKTKAPISTWNLGLSVNKHENTIHIPGVGTRQVSRIDDEYCDDRNDQVKDYLQDGDELITNLRSQDIWLNVNIQFDINCNNLKELLKLEATIQVKVNRSWTNSHLAKALQKLVIRILNSYVHGGINKEEVFIDKAFLLKSITYTHPPYQKFNRNQKTNLEDYFSKERSNPEEDEVEQELSMTGKINETFDFESKLNIKCQFQEQVGVYKQSYVRLQNQMKQQPQTMKHKQRFQDALYRGSAGRLQPLLEESKEFSPIKPLYFGTGGFAQSSQAKQKLIGVDGFTSKFNQYFNPFSKPQQTNSSKGKLVKTRTFNNKSIDLNQQRIRFGSTNFPQTQEFSIVLYGPQNLPHDHSFVSQDHYVNTIYGTVIVPMQKQQEFSQDGMNITPQKQWAHEHGAKTVSSDTSDEASDEEQQNLLQSMELHKMCTYDEHTHTLSLEWTPMQVKNGNDDLNMSIIERKLAENVAGQTIFNARTINNHVIEPFVLSKEELAIIKIPLTRNFNIKRINQKDKRAEKQKQMKKRRYSQGFLAKLWTNISEYSELNSNYDDDEDDYSDDYDADNDDQLYNFHEDSLIIGIEDDLDYIAVYNMLQKKYYQNIEYDNETFTDRSYLIQEKLKKLKKRKRREYRQVITLYKLWGYVLFGLQVGFLIVL